MLPNFVLNALDSIVVPIVVLNMMAMAGIAAIALGSRGAMPDREGAGRNRMEGLYAKLDELYTSEDTPNDDGGRREQPTGPTGPTGPAGAGAVGAAPAPEPGAVTADAAGAALVLAPTPVPVPASNLTPGHVPTGPTPPPPGPTAPDALPDPTGPTGPAGASAVSPAPEPGAVTAEEGDNGVYVARIGGSNEYAIDIESIINKHKGDASHINIAVEAIQKVADAWSSGKIAIIDDTADIKRLILSDTAVLKTAACIRMHVAFSLCKIQGDIMLMLAVDNEVHDDGLLNDTQPSFERVNNLCMKALNGLQCFFVGLTGGQDGNDHLRIFELSLTDKVMQAMSHASILQYVLPSEIGGPNMKNMKIEVSDFAFEVDVKHTYPNADAAQRAELTKFSEAAKLFDVVVLEEVGIVSCKWMQDGAEVDHSNKPWATLASKDKELLEPLTKALSVDSLTDSQVQRIPGVINLLVDNAIPIWSELPVESEDVSDFLMLVGLLSAYMDPPQAIGTIGSILTLVDKDQVLRTAVKRILGS
jgi:hypothetical protein